MPIYTSNLRRRNGRYSCRIVLPRALSAIVNRREIHIALRTTDVYVARVLSSSTREHLRRFLMTLPHTAPDTYAARLDRWIVGEKDLIAAHIAEHGTQVFTPPERDRMAGKVEKPSQLDLEDHLNEERANEEIRDLERLFFAVGSLKNMDHRVRIHDAMMQKDEGWRAIIAPWLLDARAAIAPQVSDPTKCAIIEREVARRLHEVFGYFGAVLRGEDAPHSLMREPLNSLAGDVAPSVAINVSEPNETLAVCDTDEPTHLQQAAPPTFPLGSDQADTKLEQTISELLPLFLADVTPMKKERHSAVGWTLSTAKQAQSSLRLLMAICGDKPPSKLIAADGAEFKRKARQLPAKYGQSDACADAYAANDIDALIAIRGAALEEAKGSNLELRLSDKTYNKHYSALSKFWEWCIHNSVIPKEREFFLKGHFIKIKKNKTGYVPVYKRSIWENDQLIQLFSSTIFTGMQAHRYWKDPGVFFVRDTRYWMIVIGALHGMRANEIAQLKVKHVCIHKSDTKGEIAYFDLTADDLDLKESGSDRRVPLHRHMLALAFLEDRVIGRKPDEYLFPEIEAENALNKRSAPFGGFFQRLTEHLDIEKVFHELRNTVATLLYRAGVPISHCEEIVGHESPGRSKVFADYNAGLLLEDIKEHIDKIEMPFAIEAMMAMAQKATPWREYFAGRLDRRG
jgi:integrase